MEVKGHSKGVQIKYCQYNHLFNINIGFVFYNSLANTYGTFQSHYMTRYVGNKNPNNGINKILLLPLFHSLLLRRIRGETNTQEIPL